MYNVLCQGWELEDDLETLSNSNEPQGGYPFRSLYLCQDSTYIRNPRNDFEYGRWQYNAATKTISLKPRNGTAIEYKIAALGLNELVAVKKGENSKLKFVGPGKHHTNTANNPWHISNNMWRIKPSSPEKDEAIRKRMREFLYFHILFYRDNIGRSEKIISFYGIPTCLKWYAGGIFILKENDLPDNWIACFYNREQALKGRKLIDDIIGKKYNWNKARINWVMKNEEVLMQMYEKL
jgi:hypothetical protein